MRNDPQDALVPNQMTEAEPIGQMFDRHEEVEREARIFRGCLQCSEVTQYLLEEMYRGRQLKERKATSRFEIIHRG
jgi:hypothetical protein